MGTTVRQRFLSEVLKAAGRRCGPPFLRQINYIRMERERLLNFSWKKTSESDAASDEKSAIFRQIDFDTIVLQSGRFLSNSEYALLLFEISQIAERYGELDKTEQLIKLITSRYSDVIELDVKAKIFKLKGDVAVYRNDFTAAEQDYSVSYEIYEDLKDDHGTALLQNSLGVLMIQMGRQVEGLKYLTDAHELADRCRFKDILIDIMYNLGNVNHILGEYEKSMEWYETALSEIEPEKFPDAEANLYHNLGIVYKSSGDYDQAQEYYERSYRIAKENENIYLTGLSYLEQADVACRIGEFAASTAKALSGFQIFTQLGDKLSIAEVYKVLGMVNRETKKFDVAKSYFQNSIRMNEEYNNPLNLGETYFELAVCFQQMDDIDKSKENIKLAEKYFDQVEAKAKSTQVKEYYSALN